MSRHGRDLWSLEGFSHQYDEIAAGHNGWRFKADEHEIDDLRDRYECGYWHTLREFAWDYLYRAPPFNYRLNLGHPALDTPSGSIGGPQAVVSEAELSTLRGRGFEVRIETGPHATETAAKDALEAGWDYVFD